MVACAGRKLQRVRCEARIIARRIVSGTRRRGERILPHPCSASDTRVVPLRIHDRPRRRVIMSRHGRHPEASAKMSSTSARSRESATFQDVQRGAMTMQVPRLHVDMPLAAGGRITLPETAGHHVSRVLRLGAGDALTVFDGRGGEYRATLVRVSRAAVEVDVGAHDPVERESALAIELGQGLCKGDRMDLVVQKATELGVGTIRPISASAPS